MIVPSRRSNNYPSRAEGIQTIPSSWRLGFGFWPLEPTLGTLIARSVMNYDPQHGRPGLPQSQHRSNHAPA